MIERGDIWQVGPHVVACGDLEVGAAEEMLDLYGPPDVSFTDPPWNPAIAKTFRKWADDARSVDMPILLSRVLAALRRTRGDVFLEMGREYQDEMERLLTATGASILRKWQVPYKEHFSWMTRVRWPEATATAPPDPPIVDGKRLNNVSAPKCCLAPSAAEGAKVVFDPCLGLGGTALAADALGMKVIGMELVPKRLERTILALQGRGNTDVRLVGKLTRRT